MKLLKNFKKRNLAVALFIFFVVSSCKKDKDLVQSDQQIANPSMTGLAESQKVHSTEVLSWLNTNVSAEHRTLLQLDKMQQKIVDHHQVFKIPISNNAAMFFTKDSAQLKVFAYKWYEANPGEKNYTGNVVSFSYQNYSMAFANFKDGKYVLGGKTLVGKPAFGIPAQTGAGGWPVNIKANSLFGDIWCVLTGGEIVPNYGTSTTTCDYSSGWAALLSQFLADLFSGGASISPNNDFGNDSETPIGVNYGPNPYSGADPTAGGGSTTSSANEPYQGGPVWVSLFVPRNPNDCAVYDENGIQTRDPNGCPAGDWQNVQVNPEPDPEVSTEPMNLINGDPDDIWWTDDSMSWLPHKSLPSYTSMIQNYPKSSNGGDLAAGDVASIVGGEVLQLYVNNGYTNACALRVSIALNKSGIDIPFIQDHTFQGADGKYYFLSAAKLFHYLKKTFGNPDIDMNTNDGGTKGINYKTRFSGHKGLFVMIPVNSGPNGFNASGHASIFDGTYCVGGIGHTPYNVPGGVKEIVLWILP